MVKSLALLPLLASLPAFAQQGDPGRTAGKVPPLTFKTPSVHPSAPFITTTPLVRHAMLGGCPVSIAATPQGSPHSVWVTSVEDGVLRGRQVGTGVHVRLASRFQEIAELSVEVDYRVFDGAYPVTSALPRLQSKTFQLTAAGFHIIERNLLLPPHAQVARVNVVRVAYADGTEWSSEFSSLCSVKPSLMVLVGRR